MSTAPKIIPTVCIFFTIKLRACVERTASGPWCAFCTRTARKRRASHKNSLRNTPEYQKNTCMKYIFIIPRQRALSGVHHIIEQGMCLACTRECQVVNNGAVSCKSSSRSLQIHVLKGDTGYHFWCTFNAFIASFPHHLHFQQGCAKLKTK
jgi:hypothetical protein